MKERVGYWVSGWENCWMATQSIPTVIEEEKITSFALEEKEQLILWGRMNQKIGEFMETAANPEIKKQLVDELSLLYPEGDAIQAGILVTKDAEDSFLVYDMYLNSRSNYKKLMYLLQMLFALVQHGDFTEMKIDFRCKTERHFKLVEHVMTGAEERMQLSDEDMTEESSAASFFRTDEFWMSTARFRTLMDVLADQGYSVAMVYINEIIPYLEVTSEESGVVMKYYYETVKQDGAVTGFVLIGESETPVGKDEENRELYYHVKRQEPLELMQEEVCSWIVSTITDLENAENHLL